GAGVRRGIDTAVETEKLEESVRHSGYGDLAFGLRVLAATDVTGIRQRFQGALDSGLGKAGYSGDLAPAHHQVRFALHEASCLSESRGDAKLVCAQVGALEQVDQGCRVDPGGESRGSHCHLQFLETKPL